MTAEILLNFGDKIPLIDGRIVTIKELFGNDIGDIDDYQCEPTLISKISTFFIDEDNEEYYNEDIDIEKIKKELLYKNDSTSPIKIQINKQHQVITYLNQYDLTIKVTPEFMNEPDEIISREQKFEYISECLKQEFYKHLIEKGL